MTTKADTSGLINVATIAEIAEDVNSPSAVSNWRARRADFPAPRSGTGRRVLFDLDEIETWLRENGKLEGRVPPRIRLRAILDGLRGELPIEDALDFLRAALVYLVASRRSEGEALGGVFAVPVALEPEASWPEVREADRPLTALARAARMVQANNPELLGGLLKPLEDAHRDGVADAQQLGLIETLDFGLERDGKTWQERAVEAFDELMEMETSGSPRFSAETTTSRSISELIAGLAPTRTESIFDPAVGTGGLLSEVAKEVEPIRLFAADDDHDAAVFTRSRFFIEDRPLEFFEGSSLTRSSTEWPEADLVVADPPFGLAKWGTSQDYSSPRWKFGDVSPRTADFAWLQIGALTARPGGSALILAPVGSLSDGAEAGKSRMSMVEQGVVEAVIQLPSGSHGSLAVQSALWILRSADSPEPDRPILLVDATGLARAHSRPRSIRFGAWDEITDLVEIWRSGSRIPEAARDIAVEVPIAEIQEGDLLPARYLSSPTVDVGELEQRREALESEIRELLRVELPAGSLDFPTPSESVPTAPLGQLVEILGSAGYPKEDSVFEEDAEGRVRFFDRRALMSGEPRFALEDEIPSDATPLLPGDLLLASDPRGLSIELMGEESLGSFFGRGVFLLRVRNPQELTPQWLRLFFGSAEFERQAKLAGDWFRSRGTSVPRFKRNSVETYEIPLPPVERQLEAAEASERVTDLIARARRMTALSTDLEKVMSDLAMYGGNGN